MPCCILGFNLLRRLTNTHTHTHTHTHTPQNMKTILYRLILLPLLMVIPFLSQAQELLPASTTGQVIKHSYYTLSYSEPHEQAEWVYYELTPAQINGNTQRTDNFRPDPNVSTGSASLADYKTSGFDRGHLCPAGSMKLNRTSMK